MLALGGLDVDLGLQPVQTPVNLVDGTQVLLESHLLGGMVKAQAVQPLPVTPAPRAYPCWGPQAVAQQELQEALTGSMLILLGVLSGSGQIPQRLMGFVGHPDRLQFPCAQQLSQPHRVPAVGLHPVANSNRNQGGRHNHAADTHLLQQAIQLVARWARFVTRNQLLRLPQLFHQLAHRLWRVLNLPVVAGLAATSISRVGPRSLDSYSLIGVGVTVFLRIAS